MKRLFTLIAMLLLASGLVLAQDNTSAPPADQPQAQPQSSQTTQTDVGQPTDTDQPVFKGCISGSNDNFTLVDQASGTTYRLHSDKDINEHVGKMVELRGTIKQEGADRPSDVSTPAMKEIDVADIKDTGNCDNSGASAALPQGDQSASAAPADSAAQPPASESASASATASDQGATASAGTQPAASEPATSASSEQAAPASEPAAPAASASADQQAATSTDASAQHADHDTMAQDNAAAGDQSAQNLPQTASPLPLLGLLGLGSFAAGLFGRRK